MQEDGSSKNDEALLGDIMHIHYGPHVGWRGTIEWIVPDSKFCVHLTDSAGSGDIPVGTDMILVEPCNVCIELTLHTFTLTKDKGYDLAVGDIVEVARGNWYCHQGVVKVTSIPIRLCCKIKKCSDHGLSKFIGCDVTLHSLDRMHSLVVLLGHQLIHLKNNQVAILTSVLLNGTILPPAQMQALMALHEQSFTMIPPLPCAAIPPLSSGPSGAPPEGPWALTADDIIPASEVPCIGNIPWLFQPGFCNFTKLCLGLTVSVRCKQVSLRKHVIWTAYPNPFCGEDDPVPPGCVCVTVTGHNAGSGIQHLNISACYLTPANPTGKNPLSVIKGLKAGRVVYIKEYEGNFPFSDICAALKHNHGL
ncbi:hypothetical protein V8B97DRAFT_2021110 [Scleroderma yunnanense]